MVIFSGLVMFSSFVSSMTSAMDLINKLNFEQRQKSTALRRYITENRAPRVEKGLRMERFLGFALEFERKRRILV